MATLKLPITLTPKQGEVERSPARFKLLKWGRRTGKTWYIGFWLVKNALTRQGKHWYVTKTLSLGREELWPVLLHLIPADLLVKADERLLTITVRCGSGLSTISVKSGEKENNLRGRGLASVVLDEAAFLREMLWDQILRPQLAHSMGPALIASSPKKGWFTRLFNMAATGTDPQWLASHATIYDNPTVKPAEIEAIKAKTPESTWRQEYMAEELANVGQVYEEFKKENIYTPSSRFIDFINYPTVAGIDYGHWDATGVGWIGFSPEGYAVISRCHQAKNWDVQRHASVINTVSAGYNLQGRYVLDRTAFRKEATSMTSIGDLFAKEGILCQPSEKDLTASVDIVKRFMRGDGRTPWLYVSSDCPEVIQGFQDWEHGDHEPDVIAGVRYGLVWGVRRKLTRLADAIPVPRLPSEPPLDENDRQAIMIARGKVRLSTGGARWAWDHTAGVPL